MDSGLGSLSVSKADEAPRIDYAMEVLDISEAWLT
jgi:hypothetical protein